MQTVTRNGRSIEVVLLGDPNTGLPRPDGAVVAISTEHARTHDGKAFMRTQRFTLANGASHDVLLDPAGAIPHLRMMVLGSTSTPVRAALYEDPTTSANGTLANGLNMNRLSATVPGMQCYSGPTVSAAGNLLEDGDIVGAAKKEGGVASDSAETEWILNLAKKYLLRVTNNSGASADLLLKLFWYEV